MFVPAHVLVTAEGAQPSQWMLVLHGIYGSGANWRTFARRLTEMRPEWGLVLVDLRMHGASQDAPPPHTVAAAAADLRVLTEQLAAAGRTASAVCGHSFGGKVALAYGGAEHKQVWMLDSSPSARADAMEQPDNTVAAVLRLLEDAPAHYAERSDFLARVTTAGFPRMLGNWLAMNLEAADEGYGLRLDAGAMRALLESYYATDLWSEVERLGDGLEVVIAGKSSAVTVEDRERLQKTAAVHVLEEAGHWLHIDALEPLLELLATRLQAPASPPPSR